MIPYDIILTALLTAIAGLLAVFVWIFKGLASDVGDIKITIGQYKVKHEDYDRRLENIERRCMIHSNMLHDIDVSIGGMK